MVEIKGNIVYVNGDIVGTIHEIVESPRKYEL